MTTEDNRQITIDPSGKKYLTTRNPYEIEFGYHRAIRKGPFITVSGTTAAKLEDELKKSPEDTSKVHFPDDPKEQASLAMSRCIDAVMELGGRLEDIVRVRMFVAKSQDCSEIGAAFRDHFSAHANQSEADTERQSPNVEIGAAATMIVVRDGFIDPDMLVEVEVDAIVL